MESLDFSCVHEWFECSTLAMHPSSTVMRDFAAWNSRDMVARLSAVISALFGLTRATYFKILVSNSAHLSCSVLSLSTTCSPLGKSAGRLPFSTSRNTYLEVFLGQLVQTGAICRPATDYGQKPFVAFLNSNAGIPGRSAKYAFPFGPLTISASLPNAQGPVCLKKRTSGHWLGDSGSPIWLDVSSHIWVCRRRHPG